MLVLSSKNGCYQTDVWCGFLLNEKKTSLIVLPILTILPFKLKKENMPRDRKNGLKYGGLNYGMSLE